MYKSIIIEIPRNNYRGTMAELNDMTILNAINAPLYADHGSREAHHQRPYNVKIKRIQTNAKGIEPAAIFNIIEHSLDPTVIIIENDQGNEINRYFLAESVDSDPWKRLLL